MHPSTKVNNMNVLYSRRRDAITKQTHPDQSESLLTVGKPKKAAMTPAHVSPQALTVLWGISSFEQELVQAYDTDKNWL